MRKFDADRDNLKRKILSVNFRIKKIQASQEENKQKPDPAMSEKEAELMKILNEEKTELKK